MEHKFEKFLQKLPPAISPSLKKVRVENINVMEFKKGDTVIDEFFNNMKAYYILKGSCVRYIITSKGDEKE
jgi:hypothetical protein